MNAIKHLQLAVGVGYPASDILSNLDAEDILEEMENYRNRKFDPYKPLKELANDEKACRMLWNKLFPHSHFSWVKLDSETGAVNLWGTAPHPYESNPNKRVSTFLVIWDSGSIDLLYQLQEFPLRRQFEIVDFIRSLGYSA